MAKRATKPVQRGTEDDAPARIVKAATSLFARQGFDGTSTKDICEAADVNIAAIHYHFESKEDLYRYIIHSFGGSRLQSVQRILLPPESVEEVRIRLQLFLSESLEVCVQQPDLCRIVQAEIELLHARSEEVFRNTFVKLFGTLVSFLQHAQAKSLISPGLDPKIAAQFLFNQLRQVTRADGANTKFFGMSIKDNAFRARWLEQTINLYVNGLSGRAG